MLEKLKKEVYEANMEPEAWSYYYTWEMLAELRAGAICYKEAVSGTGAKA